MIFRTGNNNSVAIVSRWLICGGCHAGRNAALVNWLEKIQILENIEVEKFIIPCNKCLK